ncbi:MAG: haloacid dehalogenase type II [Alphaproteobacteria bacterium]|nr:haloacid dehalogenase type II [Alphaproteobacteria bacterium]
MTEVRAVLFDVFGTVVDWRASLIADLQRFGEGRGIAADWPALVDAWRGAYRPSMDRVRKGEQAWTALDDLHRASLVELVAHFGVAGLSEADIDRITDLWHRLRPWPDSVPGLTRLKRRFVVGSLSNGNVALQVDLAKSAGLPWDVIFASDHFRHFKPDAETYLGACALLRLPPARVMLAAAHNDDLRAARSFGLATGFIPRPDEYGPHQRRDTAAEEAWDVVATSIEDLAARLGA